MAKSRRQQRRNRLIKVAYTQHLFMGREAMRLWDEAWKAEYKRLIDNGTIKFQEMKQKSDKKLKTSQQELQVDRTQVEKKNSISLDVYNNYLRKEGQKVLTQKEFDEMNKHLTKLEGAAYVVDKEGPGSWEWEIPKEEQEKMPVIVEFIEEKKKDE